MSSTDRSKHQRMCRVAVVAAVALVAAAAPVWAGDCPPACRPTPTWVKTAGPVESSQALVLEQYRSIIMRFQGMKRVAVVYPEIADVSVVSKTELIVRGVNLGETMLYVWDARGLHKLAVSVVGNTPAELRARELKKSLGPALSVRAFSATTVVVEGQVKDEVALRNLNSLLDAFSDDQAQVISMVTVEGMYLSASARAAGALSKVLDERLKTTAWGETSLLIEGELDDYEQVLRARQLIGAFSEGLKVVDMICVKGETLADQAPVAQIQKVLGEGFRVWPLQGNLVAVDGQVSSAEELERVNGLLAAFAPQAQTINLVQVVPPKPDLATAQSTLQAALGADGKMTVTIVGEEALMLEGSVPSEEREQQVAQVLALFEGRVPIVNLLTIVEPDKRQVMVAVKVVDINRGATENLGVDWGQYGGTRFVNAEFRPQPFLFGNIAGLGWRRLYEWGTQIHALVAKQRARILSEPNLLVNDGEEASILVGGQIPIPVAQAGVGGAAAVTIEWKDYGVLLKMSPTISPDNENVLLEVAPEVSTLDWGNAVTVGGILLPAMRTRKTQTIITVPDGGVLAIGGLLQSEQSKAVDKIPILGDLPIIGQLFRHDTFITNKSELIILVLPQILDEEGKPLHPIPVPEGLTPEQVFTFGHQPPLAEIELDKEGHWPVPKGAGTEQ